MRTGERMAQLDAVAECPARLDYVFVWFCELSASRGGSGFGFNPLSFSEIDAWCRRTGRDPDAFETRCLFALDAHWLSEQAERQAAK